MTYLQVLHELYWTSYWRWSWSFHKKRKGSKSKSCIKVIKVPVLNIVHVYCYIDKHLMKWCLLTNTLRFHLWGMGARFCNELAMFPRPHCCSWKRIILSMFMISCIVEHIRQVQFIIRWPLRLVNLLLKNILWFGVLITHAFFQKRIFGNLQNLVAVQRI